MPIGESAWVARSPGRWTGQQPVTARRYRAGMHPRKPPRPLSSGSHANVRFVDLLRLAEACGFPAGPGHRQPSHPRAPDIPTLLNLQDVSGQPSPTRYGGSCVWSSGTICVPGGPEDDA